MMRRYLTKPNGYSWSYFLVFSVLDTFQERKKDPICCAENALEKKVGDHVGNCCRSPLRFWWFRPCWDTKKGEVNRSDRDLGDRIDCTWWLIGLEGRGWRFCDLSEQVGHVPVTEKEPRRKGLGIGETCPRPWRASWLKYRGKIWATSRDLEISVYIAMKAMFMDEIT